MLKDGKIYLGLADDQRIELPLNMASRHGLIAGASGTGKTITMKVLAESFSDAGVPVFVCDVKGDVSGLAQAGKPSDSMSQRIAKFGLEDVFSYKSYPCTFWDIYQKQGHPIRITPSAVGPDLLSRLLELTPAQDGVLHILFQIADDAGLILSDLKDVDALISLVNENRKEYCERYGNISAQSLGGIQRALLPLKQSGGDLLFGLPELDLADWLGTTAGQGKIQVLDGTRLSQDPLLYSTFLLWMLSELYAMMPEAGDLDKPKMVLFFDEAHLIFDNAPKALVSKIEQIIRLIRSKGVGVYFISQSPSDLPDSVLAQLSNRIQHALRAYTPADQKALKAAASSFRPNPAFKAEEVISNLGIGHALTSMLDEEGVPSMAMQTAIICPQSLMAPCDPSVRAMAMKNDGMARYDEAIDPVTAYEVIQEQKEKAQEEARKAAEEEARRVQEEAARKQAEKEALQEQKKKEKEAEAKRRAQEKEAQAKARKQEQQEARQERQRLRRKEQIERQLINTGASLLKRSLLNTLTKKR